VIDYVHKEAEEAQRSIDEVGLSCQPESLEAAVSRRKLQHERREAPRFEMTTTLTATIFAAAGGNSHETREQTRLVREGFTNDISLSGACIVLKDKLAKVAIDQLVGQRIKLRLNLKEDSVNPVHVLGKIVWGKEKDQRATFGVQFTDMPESDRAILSRHCVKDSGEMGSISDLWEALVVKKDVSWGRESR
jgi:c-di-GMP-binding flagellar brake protein YcgR